MTLILGMSKPDGVYMGVDFRVTDMRSGKRIDDASVKFLTVHYPPDKGGPKALFAYTGVAILRDGTPTGAWIRETLRGEAEPFDQSMSHLRERLNRDIAGLRRPLIINILVIQGERRYIGAFSNVHRTSGRPSARFDYMMQELQQPFCFANGSGAARLLADKHFDLIRGQLSVWPRKPRDHMGLLAAVNRRVAAKDPSVSPSCHVSFIDSDGASPTAEVFHERGEHAPFEMPIISHGLDLSVLARGFHEQFLAMKRGEDPGQYEPDMAAVNKELKRRP